MIGAGERLVVDASVAVKWVVPETGSQDAENLLDHELCAPDLICPECANIFWKKVRRREISLAEAEVAAQTLENSGVILHSARGYLGTALQIAVAIDHPAYDCVYIALAEALSLRLITADGALVRKLAGTAFAQRVAALGA